jgi:hypothetical protein
MRAKYQARMARCEAAWCEGEPLAVAEAATWTHLHRQPIPAWLADAIVELTVKGRTPAQAKRHQEAQKDLTRYRLVCALKEAGWSWLEAYARASGMLEGTLAKGDEETMARSYKAVKDDLKKGRWGEYFTLKDWRYRNNGKPDSNGPTHAPVTDQGNARGK